MARRLEEIDGSKQDYEQSLQQLVNQSPWPAGLVRDRLQRWVAASSAAQVRRHLGGSAAAFQRFLILDETGFAKQGKSSVGVSRQYSGTLGKVASCQIAVTLQYAIRKGHLLAALPPRQIVMCGLEGRYMGQKRGRRWGGEGTVLQR